MKKYLLLLLALCLLTAGCGKGQEAPTTEPPASEAPTIQETEPETAAPETTAPKTREVQVMGDHIPVIRLLLRQGETLEVTGYEGTLAKVTAGEEQGLVETGFLRFPDALFESRTAYALWNAGLYPDFSCLGEPLEKLATNTKLEVLEELENCLYVQAGEKLGFVPLAQQSRYPYQAPADNGSGSSGSAAAETDGSDGDEMLPAAVDVILETGQASVSMLQRRLKLGYARAARIMDEMEERGLVGPFEGSKPRQLLITREQWQAIKDGAPISSEPVEEEIP